jgi:hypothetical protein
MPIKTQATIEDLYHVPENGKAEIVNGELRLTAPTGDLPGSAADEVFVSLRAHARRTGVGRAYGDNKGFIVSLPNRKSFSPMPPTTSAHGQGGSSWKALRYLPWKCAAKVTTAQRPSGRWRPSAVITSLPVRKWCGMSTS